MFNERDVCEEVIDDVCHFIWPKSRLLVQVLDDSTDAETRRRVSGRVSEKERESARKLYTCCLSSPLSFSPLKITITIIILIIVF